LKRRVAVLLPKKKNKGQRKAEIFISHPNRKKAGLKVKKEKNWSKGGVGPGRKKKFISTEGKKPNVRTAISQARKKKREKHEATT